MKEKKSRVSQLGTLVKSSDLFGKSIGFRMNGQSTYGSYIGAICSLAVIIVTLSYAAQRLEVML